MTMLAANPHLPELVLDAGQQISCLQYNPKEKRILVGGLCNGQICYWDTRKGPRPVSHSGFYDSHRDVPSTVIWIASKTGNECFSASPDGQMIWWDVRNFQQPLETMLLDLEKNNDPKFPQAVGVTCLEYEPTVPNKFMAGTEKGLAVIINRKAKLLSEKIGTIFNCHMTPIRSLCRNPSLYKVFLSAGDWTWRLWSEDSRESCILSSGFSEYQIAVAEWNPVRSSVFYVARKDGVVDIWDLLLKLEKPVAQHTVTNVPLTALAVHEEGRYTIVGDDSGTATVVETSNHFARMEKQEKQVLLSSFERKTHGEKLIEAKTREMRLRAKTVLGPKSPEEAEAEPELLVSPVLAEFQSSIKNFESKRYARFAEMNGSPGVLQQSTGHDLSAVPSETSQSITSEF